jgi:ribosomal protein S18 acetylase RimI-like enzyme
MSPAPAAAPDLEIGPVRAGAIPAIVAIHRTEIGYSLNSKLGAEHLTRLYQLVETDRDSVIVAAYVNNEPAGVVIATLDPSRLMRQVRAGLGPRGLFGVLLRVASSPRLLAEIVENAWLGRPTTYRGRAVVPCLLAIAVRGDLQGRGVGKALVSAVDAFCRSAGRSAYRLDTRVGNLDAQAFYRRNGFHNVERRGRNLVWVKELG